jgi:hypothetical protein
MGRIFRSPLPWVFVVLFEAGCDALLFLGGYQGVASVKLLIPLKFLNALAAVVILLILVRSYVRERRYFLTPFAVICCLLATADLLLMRGYSSPFFVGARNRMVTSVDPNKLQDWAITLLEKTDPSNDLYIPPKEIPAFAKIPGWHCLGAYVRNFGVRHVDLAWGSGMSGTYGISVGSPQFIANSGFDWRPGIYVYNAP